MPHAVIAAQPTARFATATHSEVAASRRLTISRSRRKAMFNKLAALAFALTLAVPGLLLAATPVNINQADAATIAKSLDGIGQSRAQAIVDWRTAHGPFKKADELRRVKGIGKATIERNRDAILLGDDATGAVAKTDAPAKSAYKSKKAAAEEAAAEE
jgi:competence protein ComEA helix-hairpin-helix repeat region